MNGAAHWLGQHWTAGLLDAALLIEMVGSLYVVGYVLAGLWALLHGPPEERLVTARLLVAEGALAGLNFKVAGSLLKTIELQSWQQIGLFAATFALRTVLKRLFSWERSRLRATLPPAAPRSAARVPGQPDGGHPGG